MPRNVSLVELSPLKAATLLWQPEIGTPVLTIVCKATYRLEPGVAPLADAQDGVNQRDLHSENNPNLGLHSASDLAPYKSRGDVTVVGKAFARPNELASSVVARVQVGTVDKRVEVHAERYINRRGEVRANAFFSKMPIGYERAAGGPDSPNPIGRSRDADPDDKGRVALPNLQVPGEVVTGRGTALTPVGLGPIPATWPTRRLLAEGLSLEMRGDDWLGNVIPASCTWAFFNVAPRDQQLDEIRADQHIHLEHLHPDEPVLDTRLPGCRPWVFVERTAGAQHVRLRADTLWIDTNRLVHTLTWRGQITLVNADEAVRVLVAMVDHDREPSWDEVWMLAEQHHKRSLEPPPPSRDELRTRVDGQGQRAPSSRNQTSPVPLVPSSDHSPGWLPVPHSVRPSSPQSRGSAPSAHPSGRSGAGVVEVALGEGEMRKLHELAFVRGVSPAEVLRQLLGDASGTRGDP